MKSVLFGPYKDAIAVAPELFSVAVRQGRHSHGTLGAKERAGFESTGK